MLLLAGSPSRTDRPPFSDLLSIHSVLLRRIKHPQFLKVTVPYLHPWSLKGSVSLRMSRQAVAVTSSPGSTASAISGWAIFAVQESLVSEEIVHDLDTCEVTVEGEELNGEQESLEVDAARLQQKGIEMSSSDMGVVFTGGKSDSSELSSQLKTWREP